MESRPGSAPVLDRDPTIPQPDTLDSVDVPLGPDGNPLLPSGEQPVDTTELLEADKQNRFVDREILGRSVQVKLDVQEKAQDAITHADQMVTRGRNLLSTPKTAWRKMRLDRAENGLKNRNERLQEKHQARLDKSNVEKEKLQEAVDAKRAQEQLWVDSASSMRLREKRQQQIDAKHSDRQAKLDRKKAGIDSKVQYKYNRHEARVKNYERSVFNPRKERYESAVGIMTNRTESADARKTERLKSIEQSRDAALCKKELAVARKALRASLRGPENKASRRETSSILDEIFGEASDADVKKSLRDLGRKVVATQYAERQLGSAKLQGYQIERQTVSTEQLIDRAKKRRVSLSERADADEIRLAGAKTSLDTMTARLYELRTQDETTPGEALDIADQIAEAKREIESLEKSITDARDQVAAIPGQITELHTKLAELRTKSDEARTQIELSRAQTAVARDEQRSHTDTILNSDQSTTHKTGGA